MRWSLRDQILLPLLGIVTVAITTIALAAAALAARRSEEQTLGQLRRVIATLGRSSFPITPTVLEKMHGLSGAHFVAYDARGRAVAMTLPGPPPAFTDSLRGPTQTHEPGSLAGYPTLELDGTRYLSAGLRTAGGPEGVAALLVLYPETSWRQARRDAALPPLVVGVGALGLTAAAAAWTAHRLSARIGSLQRQVAAIAAGDFRELDLGRRRDEVQDLMRSVNRMSTQLRRMQEEIRRTERAGVLAQLAAGLAHQLRNAVTGARMAVQLHRRRRPPEGEDRSLDVALRQLTLMEEQVKGLLSLGRREGRPPAPCEAGRLVEEVAELVGPACEHTRVDLRRGPPTPGLTVVADPDGLRAAVLNLTLNAIEAAGPGGRVDLAASAGAGEVRIEVRDSGPGPPPELAEALFDPFVTGKPGGVGLGLALARQVAADAGGALSWGREAGFTRFRLALPAAGVAVEEAR